MHTAANPEKRVLHEQNGVSVWYIVCRIMMRYGKLELELWSCWTNVS